MMALALCEDSISLRARRDAIIDSLGTLPDKIRAVRAPPPRGGRARALCLPPRPRPASCLGWCSARLLGHLLAHASGGLVQPCMPRRAEAAAWRGRRASLAQAPGWRQRGGRVERLLERGVQVLKLDSQVLEPAGQS
jgi:hypothetical protein